MRMRGWRRVCYRFYWSVKPLLAPNLQNSQASYCRALQNTLPTGSRWLDVGCGHQVLGAWMAEEEAALVKRAGCLLGMDLSPEDVAKHRSLHSGFVGDAERIPLEDGSVDSLTMNMVAEHIRRPQSVLGEVRRVLRPGGLCVIHTPNLLNFKVRALTLLPQTAKSLLAFLLESRKEADVFPTFYRMNTPRRLRALCAENGMELVDMELFEDSPSSIMLGPVVIFELLVIRLFETRLFENWRSNIVAVFRKPAEQ